MKKKKASNVHKLGDNINRQVTAGVGFQELFYGLSPRRHTATCAIRWFMTVVVSGIYIRARKYAAGQRARDAIEKTLIFDKFQSIQKEKYS